MPLFTVQCSFASYDAKTVVVEAETIEQALDRAIVVANGGDGWSSLDVCGDTFVDPWTDFASSLTISPSMAARSISTIILYPP
jgi:hypothetical protein